ncbi:MAG TPA: ABC transporter permease [Hanamia sp.]|nr:ABC transporter permease [Hanamia sp.]
MFKNYLIVAWRNLVRKKVFSAINIFGLALGLAIFTLISLYVLDELSYDRYNELANRIYRVNTHIKVNGSEFNDNNTPAPMADALVNNYPRIEQAVRISGGGDVLVKKGDETLIEKNAFFADSNLFKVFTLHMLEGNPITALKDPNSIVISASMAGKYFNTMDVIGKTLKLDNTTFYRITGVIKDVPAQSHLHFNFIRAMAGLEFSKSNFWLSNSFMTYILVRKGTTQSEIDSYLKQTAEKYAGPQLMDMVHSSISDIEKNGGYFKYSSIPLPKIHLYSELSSEIEPSGNIQYVYISGIIGLLILLIACINFMNLSTAQSAGRAKEVGVRKVIGSGRANLIKQFLTESLLTALVAFILSGALIVLLLPLLNQLSGKEITLASHLFTWLFPALMGVALICGLLAGAYPAFVLSAFDPIKILKGKFVLNVGGYKLRNALVIFQFTTAIILITGTLVIYQQLDYIRHKNLGYDRDHVLVLDNAYALGEHVQTFKHEILQLPGVVAGSLTENLPTTTANEWNKNAYSTDATMSASHTQTIVDWAVDAGYIPALKMKIVEGRNFSEDMPTDSSAIIINETAARSLGFTNPLNAKLYDFNSQAKQTQEFHVIGVVKDFNAGSLRYTTEPLVMRYSKYGGQFIFRIKSANIPQLIAQIESRYHSFDQMSSQPFLYSFLDEDFNNLYKGEQRTGTMFSTFTALAIFIACLGLYGLAVYSAEQRTKEIGIRKVLGASVKGIISLLSKEFIRLIIVSIVIATPLAWWAMNKWLQSFAYRIHVSWWVFVVAGFTALLIALITVSFQAIKAAVANPVESLRAE